MIRTQQDRIEYIAFPGLDKSLGYAFPPPNTVDGKTPQSVANSATQTAIIAVGKLDDATIAAKSDGKFSPVGIALEVKPLRDAANKVIDDGLARLEVERQAIAAKRAAVGAPPQLAPTDAAGALLDAEIRSRFDSTGLGGQIIDDVRQSISNGGGERILLALLRDPFDTPTGLWARAVWAARVEHDNPDALAALDVDVAMYQWGLGNLRGLKNVLESSNSYGVSPGPSATRSGKVANA